MNTQATKNLSVKEKKYLDLLLKERDQYQAQLDFHAGEALSSANESAGERSCFTNHLAECSTDNFLHEIELSLMTNEGDIVEQIDEAIERLETGEFGSCHDCGKEINPDRLEVIPHTRLCVHCQSIREENDGKNPTFFSYDEEGNGWIDLFIDK